MKNTLNGKTTGEVLCKIEENNQQIKLIKTKFNFDINFYFNSANNSNLNTYKLKKQISIIENSILNYVGLNCDDKYLDSILDLKVEENKNLLLDFINSDLNSYDINKNFHDRLINEFYNSTFINLSMFKNIEVIYKELLKKELIFDSSLIEFNQFYNYIIPLIDPLIDEQYKLNKNKNQFKSINKIIQKKLPDYAKLINQENYNKSFDYYKDIATNKMENVYISDIYDVLNNVFNNEYKEFIFQFLVEFAILDNHVTLKEKKYLINVSEALNLNVLQTEYSYMYEENDTTLGFNFVLKFKESFMYRFITGLLLSPFVGTLGFLLSFIMIYFFKKSNYNEFLTPPNDEYIVISSFGLFFVFSFIWIVYFAKKNKYIFKTYKALLTILISAISLLGVVVLMLK